jgi:hypothetical protein
MIVAVALGEAVAKECPLPGLGQNQGAEASGLSGAPAGDPLCGGPTFVDALVNDEVAYQYSCLRPLLDTKLVENESLRIPDEGLFFPFVFRLPYGARCVS